jgi:glycoside/pentoside/hexuronide:cation symporter, GPH family
VKTLEKSTMSTARILAYGVLGLPLSFAALPIYAHIPHYYAAVAGMSLSALGAILLVTRLLDAGIDPCLGWLADRLPRRGLLMLALPVFGAGFVALLNPPAVQAGWWLAGALMLTYLGYSAASVAYQAWGADIGATPQLRTRLTASREGFGLLGVMLAAALPSLLAPQLEAGIARLAWILPPLLLGAALVSLGYAPPAPAATRSAESLWPSLRGVFGDAAFRRLLCVFIANGMAAALPATLFLFFVADVLQLGQASGALLAVYFLAGALSLPLWVKLAARLGRVRTWLAAIALAILAFASASLLGPGDLWPFAAICVASGFSLGADLALPAAMAADLGERQGRAGACFGVWNFIAKLNLALAAGLVLPLLGAAGYLPGSGAGLSQLTLAYALLPLAFKALAGGLLWHWRHHLEIAS